jgi:hypothetical protein
VLLIAVLHFVPDSDDPYGIVTKLMDAVPSGSYLAILHGASDVGADDMPEAERRYNEQASAQFNAHNREQVSRFFGGLELVAAGGGRQPARGRRRLLRPRPQAVTGSRALVPVVVEALGVVGVRRVDSGSGTTLRFGVKVVAYRSASMTDPSPSLTPPTPAIKSPVSTPDGFEITGLQNAFGLAIDVRRCAWFPGTFTPDVEVEYRLADASPLGQWSGLDAWLGDITASHTSSTQHMMLNHLATVEGDRARAFCCGHVKVVQSQNPGQLRTMTSFYDDELRRTDKGWRISRRVFQQTFQTEVSEISAEPIISVYTEAARGEIGFLR